MLSRVVCGSMISGRILQCRMACGRKLEEVLVVKWLDCCRKVLGREAYSTIATHKYYIIGALWCVPTSCLSVCVYAAKGDNIEAFQIALKCPKQGNIFSLIFLLVPPGSSIGTLSCQLIKTKLHRLRQQHADGTSRHEIIAEIYFSSFLKTKNPSGVWKEARLLFFV